MNSSVITASTVETIVSESPKHFNELTVIQKDIADKLEDKYKQNGRLVSRLRWAWSYLELDSAELEDVVEGMLSIRHERDKLLALLLGEVSEKHVDAWIVTTANSIKQSTIVEWDKVEFPSLARTSLLALFNFLNNGK